MHKLFKQAYFIEIIHDIKGMKNTSVVCKGLVSEVKKASLTKEVAHTNRRFLFEYFLIKVEKLIFDIMTKLFQQIMSILIQFNSFMTEVVIIQKPVHWFAEQINGLVSIW